jgi:uncharacterized SAM-binding protein YcdF (DUF218 family)
MFVSLKTLLHTLLLPPAASLLLAIVGACLIRWRSGNAARRTGWALLVAGLGSLWLLATPVVAEALSGLAERYPALKPQEPVVAQAVVILGGEFAHQHSPEYGGERSVSDGLLERVSYGAYLAERAGLPVLVTGEPREALGMRATLARNFHVETRWLETRARDTFENAEFSAAMLKADGVTRIILVTDAQHEWRAAHEFASAGLEVVPAPEGYTYWGGSSTFGEYIPNATALERSTAALYELLGDVVRRALAATHLRRHGA